MTTSSHLSDNLSLLAHETSLLMRTAAGLDDDAMRRPSLCDGWTRAHVLSHIARNADGLGNLASWAVTGTPRAMYDSPEARDADIAAGATRSAQEIRTDLEDSAARFAAAAGGLAGAPEEFEVEMRGGRKVLGGQLPTLRLMEVVIHHVDLDAGYTFADTDPGFVKRAVANSVSRMTVKADAPSVTLRSQEGDTWTIGDGRQVVTGSNAALLLWLTRGNGAELASNAALPRLPSWG
ncbi:MAG: maleylpyruvate isomerase family mycothiol-dependent enzyme [Phycicoccus sp.]|nr:maleylpyruvate isomerase family mycothiol-dependent enzyme [Phycicoccus sp.]NMM35657.1 maleylpyruvate isomerase family mycothiol-dependent enzyme [Phycicoccus sp.]